MIDIEKNYKKWKLINYRTVDDLISAEFLHDLYNRHIPTINGVRFRNTICVYRHNNFYSYAPVEEWENVSFNIGERIYNMDHKLYKRLYSYIEEPKIYLHSLIDKLKNENLLKNSSSASLFFLLQELHYTALGEIYGINLVQVEEGINYALNKFCNEKKIDFIDLDAFHKFSINTEGVKANNYLRKLKEIYKDKKIIKKKYLEKYGHLENAYGTMKEVDIEGRLKSLDKNRDISPNSENYNSSKVEDKLNKILDLASGIALLRDNNKALMGKVSFYREQILKQICELESIDREKMKRYSLKNIKELIFDNEILDDKTISERNRLMVFKREESINVGDKAELIEESLINSNLKTDNKKIQGKVASKGIIRGYSKHIKDGEKLKDNEILVALGTDFNLMDNIMSSLGIITQEGGILSHASVISRELKKPCILNIDNIFSRIPDGAYIELNADNGTITLLDEPTIEKRDKFNFESLDNISEKNSWGNKINNLYSCLSKGFNVLPGIVAPINLNSDLHKMSKELYQDMKKLSANDLFVIRSSSNVEDSKNKSNAGLFNTVTTTLDTKSIYESLQIILSSITDGKIYSYNEIEKMKISILVQPYLHQDRGGVIFTVNPINNKADEIIIEFSERGAKSVVNGLNTNSVTIKRNEGYQGEFKKLIDVSTQIEKAFGFPCDIEWGEVKGKYYIFQVRPITTNKVNNDEK
ncbi:PEP/pyruvate-binding domain-containing protein [Staphylococcus saprophyticus]